MRQDSSSHRKAAQQGPIHTQGPAKSDRPRQPAAGDVDRGDDVSLWGSSTWDERNAASDGDDPIVSHREAPVSASHRSSGSMSPVRLEAANRAKLAQEGQANLSAVAAPQQSGPVAEDSGRGHTPKRSFMSMLSGQMPARKLPAASGSPPAAARQLHVSQVPAAAPVAAGLQPPTPSLKAASPSAQAGAQLAASHATIDWLRESAAALAEGDAVNDDIDDVSTPASSAPLSLPSPTAPAKRSPVPPLRLSGISNLDPGDNSAGATSQGAVKETPSAEKSGAAGTRQETVPPLHGQDGPDQENANDTANL